MNDINIPKNLSKEIKSIMIESGDILLGYFKKKIEVFKKQDQYFTKADIETENLIKNKLNDLMPNAAFWAEESGKIGNSDYCWVIDPLDGTMNFINGISYFCTSISLTYKHVPIVGAIYDPIHNDFFYAESGKGTFLNDNKVHVSKKTNLADCFIVTSFPGGWQEHNLRYWQTIKDTRNRSYSMRIMGASALDLAYVSCARFDATLFFRLNWWDIAAGILLIEQSGGKVADFKGDKISPDFETFIGGPEAIYTELIKSF